MTNRKIIVTMHSAGASKPSGKATSWPRKKENSTNKVHPRPAFGQPDVECFGILEFGTLQPMIFFSPVTDPSNQVTITTTATVLINDIMNEILF